ncbi:hypothetical protein GF415_00805 [Candidatus Micrarchaeota archaeon]|nr:hypothetical protein [Candidatus Micrarchaeota archaeon]
MEKKKSTPELGMGMGPGREMMEDDAKKIRQMSPGFQMPPKVVPLEELPKNPGGPARWEPLFSMRTKREKRD